MKNSDLPLLEDIRLSGKIAQLVRKPRKAHKCSECGIIIEVGEPYYTVEWAGAGLGGTKYPNRSCVACLPDALGIERTYEEWRQLWGELFDYCYANSGELERICRMRGLVVCLQKIWNKMEGARCSPSCCPKPSAK